jgi:glycosyltransferase involved in cell wall biosynthesis
MVRVAVFAPLLITGGTQRHLQQVLPRLDRSRFETRVYTLRPGGAVEGELRAAGIPVHSFAIGRRLGTLRTVAAMFEAARALRAGRFDIVHGYQWRPALVSTLVGRLAGVPLLLASKRSLTGDDKRARFAWRLIARGVDTLVVNAEALRVEGEAQGLPARWACIPNGVDAEWFRDVPSVTQARGALGLDPRRPVVGTVGRLEPRKGHELLLEAARIILARSNGLHPQFLIVGDGGLRDKLGAEATALGLGDSVHFAGTIADVRTPLAAMDIFVLPSHAEGMSNALLEAMAVGRPVVATAAGGTREVCDPDRTGVLVPPGDAERLATVVLELLLDRPRAGRLAEAAQRDVTERFSTRTAVARLEALYTERLAVRRKSGAGR